MRSADQAKQIASRIVQERFPDASMAFCAGSIIRGEGTQTSDIDLVIIFPSLEKAWRESFLFEGWPAEAFVHDPATLKYFFQEMDAKSGVPSLPQMVLEGAVVWGNADHASAFKLMAKEILTAGPAALTPEDIRNRIYGITDLLDDLRAPRSRVEALGIGVQLYHSLGDFLLRSKRHWSGNGKQLSRALQRQNPESYIKFVEAFEALFAQNNTGPVIAFTEQVLQAFGGPLFDGFHREAPASWRK